MAEVKDLIKKTDNSSVVKPEYHLFFRPTKPECVFVEDEIIKWNPQDDSDLEHYDIFDYYRPELYDIKAGAVKQAVDLHFTPHYWFATRKPLEFCRKFGIPKGTEISLEEYKREKNIYILFLRLLNCYRSNDTEAARKYIEASKDLFFNPSDLRFNVFIKSDKLIFLLINSIFEAKTEGVKPVFLGYLRWDFPDILPALYMIAWTEFQQGKFTASCLKCEKLFYVGKKDKFCSDKCRGNYHSQKSMAKKRSKTL